MNQTPSAFVLIAIALATLATGMGSVWLAALLMRLGLGGRNGSVGPQHLLSLAAGVLLATAFMHLLPEAFEGQAEAHDLFATLLVGLVFFFLLDKAELWHHGHEHGHAVRGTGGHGHAGRDTGGPCPNEHAPRHDGPRTGGGGGEGWRGEGGLGGACRGGRALLWRWHPDCIGLHGRHPPGRAGGGIGAGARGAAPYGRPGGAVPDQPEPAHRAAQSVAGRRGDGARRRGGLFPGRAVAGLSAVFPGAGVEQLCLCGAGRSDSPTAKAPDGPGDADPDRLAARRHGAGHAGARAGRQALNAWPVALDGRPRPALLIAAGA